MCLKYYFILCCGRWKIQVKQLFFSLENFGRWRALKICYVGLGARLRKKLFFRKFQDSCGLDQYCPNWFRKMEENLGPTVQLFAGLWKGMGNPAVTFQLLAGLFVDKPVLIRFISVYNLASEIYLLWRHVKIEFSMLENNLVCSSGTTQAW